MSTKQEEEAKPTEATPNEGEEAEAEEESTAVFQPVVELNEVDVVTGEEDEEAVWSHKSKVYVYGETLLNKGKNIKTWNERGIGDAKLLKNKSTGMIRLLMRQYKTEKILINHQVDPRICITPQAGTDRAYCWSAFDFANGEELVETIFALKFKDNEIADKFKDEFVQAQTVMTSLGVGVSAEGAAAEPETAADDVADTLAGLSTSEAADAKES